MSAQSPPVIEGFPLSAQQARAWSFHPHAAARQAQLVVSIDGPIDSRAIAEALGRIVNRHEILRTTFQALPGMQLPVQVIEPQAESPAPAIVGYVDASRVTPANASSIVSRVAEIGASLSSDVTSGPPLRSVVIARSAERHDVAIALPSVCGDQRTLSNLAGEFAAEYAAAIGAATPAYDVPFEPLQYVDYCEWQRSTPESDASAAGRRFWERQHTSPAPALVMRAARDAHAAPFSPNVFSQSVGATRAGQIRALVERHRASEAAFWMTCWSFVMWRFLRRPDVVIGQAFHGRRYPEMQAAMGPFARCLPIRCRGSWSSSFAEQLAASQQSFTEADQWQDLYAGDEAQDPDAAERTLMFELQEASTAYRVGDMTFAMQQATCHGEPFLIKLTCVVSEDDVRTDVHVDASRMPVEAARLLSAQLHLIAGAALEDAERSVGQMDLVTDVHRAFVETQSATRTELPDVDRPLAWHIEAQVARTPEAIAIAGPAGALTYTALNRLANRIARDLRERGVGPESRVAVMMRRSPRLIASLLAVGKTGAAYVPLDPTDPASRVSACIQDAGVRVALIDPGFEAPPLTGVEWLAVADAAAPRAESDCSESACPEDHSAPALRTSPDHLAYAIYTSGSTGTPKGTLITQGGLMNYLLWCVEHYQLKAGASAPLHSPPTFDLTVTTLFAPLLVGGTVVLAADVTASEALAEALQHGRSFDFIKLTPSHLQALTWQVPPATLGTSAGALIIGGEALHADMLAAWRDAAPGLRVFNEYGPTETVVGSCVYEMSGTSAAGAVPIGRPIANTQTYVLDPFGVPVVPTADGAVEGELLIGGAGVARGYLNRADLTADRFVPDPFGGTPGARLYRTGDIVRYDTSGELVYVGRRDQQVKVRGQRIELGEVEAAVRTLAEVRDAAVIVRYDQPGHSKGGQDKASQDKASTAQLVGYLVPSGRTRPSLEEMRAALSRIVPHYMVPDAVVWMDALPLGASGKVDRKALPAPVNADRSRPMVRASTAVEEVLAAIWADVLQLDEVGVHDNFFALGGDSIRAIQVRARAAERGLEISYEQIFEHQTVAALARTIGFDSRSAGSVAPAAPFALIDEDDRSRLMADLEGRVLKRADLEDAYPLAALQAGMIFHSELANDSAVFHDIHSFTLRGRFVLDELRGALVDATRRHAMLRTAFELARYSRPLQLVYRDVAPPLHVDDLQGMEPDVQRSTVERWLDEERRRPFDWREPPLLRFHVHILSDAAFQFTMSFHHAMLDGWSAASLLTEAFNRYRSRLEPAASPAPTTGAEQAPESGSEGMLRSSFRDFVALEQQAERSETAQQFWRDVLQTVPATRLAQHASAGVERSADRIGMVSVQIDMTVGERLRKLTRELALPLKSVALAAHAKVLALETDQARVLTGLVSNGRAEEVDGDRVLGLFLNTVPCAVSVAAPRWRDLVAEAFNAERRLLPFRRYPLAQLQRERGEGSLFDVAFNFMHYHVYRSVQPSEAIQVNGYFGYEETDVPLMANFSLDPQSGEMGLMLSYHPQSFERSEVERIAGRYRMVLAAMAADPDAPHAASDLLTPAERDQIVGTWTERATQPWAAAGSESAVAQLDEQAAATPDAIALTTADGSLTYRELHARAGQLARYLRAAGVGPDVPVGVCMERSSDLLVAMLGILEAGGAYVPLDPTYPPARLALVLEDAAPKVVVTQETLAGRLQTGGATVVRLDADWPAIARAGNAGDPATVAAGNLAYVIYTSGSTGRPKGVMVPHGAVINFMRGMDARIGEVAQATWLAVTSVAFDISVLELLWTLARGARVVLLPAGTPEASSAELIGAEGVTHLQCTPSWAWRLLADPKAPDALARLERLLVGGEALPQTLAGQLRARVGGRLHNMYGPTETTIWSSSDDEVDGEHVTLGRPIRNTWIHIVDRSWNLVPSGRVGEICIAGDGVVRGYLERPDLTAERFIPDAFANEPGARAYRTGDWGRLRADGRIEFVGRRDGQVKLRGHRIELAEIEAMLRAQPDVRDAVVVLREDVPGDPRLVGYVVPVSDAAAAREALKTAGDGLKTDAVQQQLRERLPEHMVPSIIVSLESLPLTPNGKIDRQRLPVPTGERPDLTQSYTAPRTDVEATLAKTWSDVLRVDRVGVHDNFFALGGHSLSATQVVARLRDAFGIELPLRPLFDAPTIAQLAPVIEAQLRSRAPRTADAIAPPIVEATPDLDALLDELEELPEDEVRALLGQELG